MHFATAIAISAAILLGAANAHSNGLDAATCANFMVRHGMNREDYSKNVTLELINEDGNVVDCFMPQQQYTVRLTANGLIKGYLLQAVTGAKLPSSRKARIPLDATRGPCSNAVSHTRKRVDDSEDLIFPLATLRKSSPLSFRYSVVFSMSSFVQDRHKEFQCCESMVKVGAINETGNTTVEETNTTNTNTTEEPPTPYTTFPPLGTPVADNCGKSVVSVNKSFNHTINNISYLCTINKPLRQTRCTESCVLDGQHVVCQVSRSIPRRKGYTCTAYEGQDNVDPDQESHRKTFKEDILKGCECFVPNSL